MTDTELPPKARLRAAHRQPAGIKDRLVDAHAAREGAHRTAYDTTSGPFFDPTQPFVQSDTTEIDGAAA